VNGVVLLVPRVAVGVIDVELNCRAAAVSAEGTVYRSLFLAIPLEVDAKNPT